MDKDTLAELQRLAGAEHGLPEALCSRLHGETVSELRSDAQAMARQFGFEATTAPVRDQRGRYTFSDQIRQATGRAPQTPEPRPDGVIGVGLGDAARPKTRNTSMSAKIRGAAGARRALGVELAEGFEGG